MPVSSQKFEAHCMFEVQPAVLSAIFGLQEPPLQFPDKQTAFLSHDDDVPSTFCGVQMLLVQYFDAHCVSVVHV